MSGCSVVSSRHFEEKKVVLFRGRLFRVFFCCLCSLSYRKSSKSLQWDEKVATMPYEREGVQEYFEHGMNFTFKYNDDV